MLACFEDASESTWGLPSVGPKRRSRCTSALTSTCSASLKPSHHAPNSSVNSTSYSSKSLFSQGYAAIQVNISNNLTFSLTWYAAIRYRRLGPWLPVLTFEGSFQNPLH